MKKVVCFGEVLFDCFPNEKKIGGAPLNVALRMHALGLHCQMISSVGLDSDGETLKTFLEQEGLSTELIQSSKHYSTGTVVVSLNEKGNASYEISQPVAWDYIAINSENKQAVEASDLFVFGSLIARQNPSKQTLLELLQLAPFSVFDINLRPPFFDWNTLLDLLAQSDFIKCNEEELNILLNHFQIDENNLEDQLRALLKTFKGKGICVTLGAEGAALIWNNLCYQQKGFPTKVADTVGAGDSFLATLLHGLLTHEKPQKSLKYACAMGALVASKQGANPKISNQELLNFIARS